MAKEAQVNKTEHTNNDSKPVASKKVTIASIFRDLAVKPSKDRQELATKILATLKSKGMDKNIRGFLIREDRVAQQISAMIRDINMERGLEKNSWWSTYKVVEGDELKIVKKA